MNLIKVVTEQRRLALLRTLAELGYSLNEDILVQALDEMSVASVSRDQVRADLTFLSDHGLARIERLPRVTGELWVAHLSVAGKEVAEGRQYPGVAHRQPDC